MHVNFVTTQEGWVLRNLAENYSKHFENSTITFEIPNINADINFYINYNLFKEKTKLDICYFTHRELEDSYLQQRFDSIAQECDWCIAMCDATAKLLPIHKTTVVLPSPDPQFLKKQNIIIGIVGREYSSGRKRFKWLDELSKIEGIEFIVTNGKYQWEEMPDFYKQIDYLLILSDNEGGPLPLYEALAMGVPVISSNVGSVGEFTTIMYQDFDDLYSKLSKLVISKDTWVVGANKINQVLQSLIK